MINEGFVQMRTGQKIISDKVEADLIDRLNKQALDAMGAKVAKANRANENGKPELVPHLRLVGSEVRRKGITIGFRRRNAGHLRHVGAGSMVSLA